LVFWRGAKDDPDRLVFCVEVAMLRSIVCFGLVLAYGSATVGQSTDKADRKQEELKWSKGVVLDFLVAAVKGEDEQAALLLSEDLRKALEKTGEPGPTFVHTRFSNNRIRSWQFLAEEIAPDQDEASFQGMFSGEQGEAAFSLRVVKVKESGKWRVQLLVLADWKKKENPPNQAKPGP
jgi:hypothetical protein